MSKAIDQMIDDLVVREGGFVDHPADRGRPTCWGVTRAKAREHGYAGDMHSLPKGTARAIYWQDFVIAMGIAALALRSPRIAAEALAEPRQRRDATPISVVRQPDNGSDDEWHHREPIGRLKRHLGGDLQVPDVGDEPLWRRPYCRLVG